jgi:hypothetical protein
LLSFKKRMKATPRKRVPSQQKRARRSMVKSKMVAHL